MNLEQENKLLHLYRNLLLGNLRLLKDRDRDIKIEFDQVVKPKPKMEKIRNPSCSPLPLGMIDSGNTFRAL